MMDVPEVPDVAEEGSEPPFAPEAEVVEVLDGCFVVVADAFPAAEDGVPPPVDRRADPAAVDRWLWLVGRGLLAAGFGCGLALAADVDGSGTGFGGDSLAGTAAPGTPPAPNEKPMTDPAGGT